MDAVTFAQAQLDADEAAAKAATPGEWIVVDVGVRSVQETDQWPVAETDSVRDLDDRAYIARYDPARALREVAAGRRILARHADCDSGTGYCNDAGCCDDWPCPDLADLLSRWDDHADYDQAWKP